MEKKDVIAFFDRCAPTWDAEMIKSDANIGKILDVRAAPDARSVLGARGVSRDRNLTAIRRRGGTASKGEGEDV